jgi:hypothetical protein
MSQNKEFSMLRFAFRAVIALLITGLALAVFSSNRLIQQQAQDLAYLDSLQQEMNHIRAGQGLKHLEDHLLGGDFASSQLADLKPLGSSPVWSPELQQKPYTLMMVFNAIECSVCLDQQMEYLSPLYKAQPQLLDMMAVVFDTPTDYTMRFRRVNRLHFPFYQADQAQVRDLLDGERPLGPLLLLIDNQQQKVVAALHARKTHPQRSLVFRDFLYRLEGREPPETTSFTYDPHAHP